MFLAVHFDNILICRRFKKEHMIRRVEKGYINLAKFPFLQSKVDFLEFLVPIKGISADSGKVTL